MCFEVFGTQPQATVPELLEAIANLRSHTVEACCDAKQIRDATMPVTESPAALGQQHRPHIEGPPLGIAMITPAEDIRSLFETTGTSPALHWPSYYFIHPMFWPTSWQCRRWPTNSRGTWLESFPQSLALETSGCIISSSNSRWGNMINVGYLDIWDWDHAITSGDFWKFV